MMNETLQKELTKHFRKITGREAFLNQFDESLKDTRNYEFESEIQKELSKKAKEFLDKENFDYEKGRNRYGSRIIFDGGVLKLRGFKQRNFIEINLLSNSYYKELADFLPEGLRRSINIINLKIEKLEKITPSFKGEIRLRKSININYIDDNELKEKGVISIILDNAKKDYSGRKLNIKIELENTGKDYYSSLCSPEESYYQDDVFRKILKLKVKLDTYLRKLNKAKEMIREGIREEIRNIDKRIVLEELRCQVI